MLFTRVQEDDDDFIPNPNYHSNLSSIFGGSGSDGNPSLTYTAPKQPKRQGKPPSSPTLSTSSAVSTKVIVAKTVQTFKMVDGAYHSLGRMGAAILSITSSEDLCVHQLLLYRDKRHHFCNTRISREFNFHIQPKNYCTFYDNHSVIWSILFDSSAEVVDFTLQVTIARWKAGVPTTAIVLQDLWCPVSDPQAVAAAIGDTVQLTFTLNPFADSTQQGEYEGHCFTVEVENSGWKQALIGAQANSLKAVVVQPYLLGDLNPKEVVYNCAVLIKLVILHVCKPSGSRRTVAQPTDTLKEDSINFKKESPRPELPPADNSTASPHHSPKATKADLITRMARMGQALPFKTAAPTPSDSDETEEDHAGRRRKAVDRAVPKLRARVQHSVAPLCPVVGATPPHTPPVTVTQPVQWTPTAYMQVGSLYSAPQLQSPSCIDSQSQFNMFFSEVRTTNSELRMGLTRLTDKVEALQSKLDNPDKRLSSDSTLVLERLLENEHHLGSQLQLVLSTLQSSQSASQVKVTAEPPIPALRTITEPCQRCTHLEQANTSLAEEVKRLKEENEYLQTSSNAQKDALQNAKYADKDQLMQIERLQKQLEEEQERVIELQEKLSKIQTEKDGSDENLRTVNITIVDLQNTVREKQTSIDNLEVALKRSEETKLEEVRRSLQEVLDPKPVIGEHIKKILNAVYRLVKVQFEPQNKYDAAFIQSVLAETIKAVTLEYLQNGDLHSESLVSVPSTPSTAGQSQSAPTVNFAQDKKEGKSIQERETAHLSVKADLPLAVCTDVASEAVFSTPKETSEVSLPGDFVHANYSEETLKDVTAAFQKVADPDEQISRILVKPNFADVETSDTSSDDRWRQQPPPPPLFDEEENEDDWLNS